MARRRTSSKATYSQRYPHRDAPSETRPASRSSPSRPVRIVLPKGLPIDHLVPVTRGVLGWGTRTIQRDDLRVALREWHRQHEEAFRPVLQAGDPGCAPAGDVYNCNQARVRI